MERAPVLLARGISQEGGLFMNYFGAMSGAEMLMLIGDLRKRLRVPSKCTIDADDDYDFHEDTTYGDLSSRVVCRIGIGNIDPHKEYEMGEAMVPIVGMCHEVCGHAAQRMHEFRKKTDLSKILALNYYAGQASPEYYAGSDNYWHQPQEIAAQYAGIKAVFGYLFNQFGLVEANRMICSYVNYRISLQSEFVRRDNPNYRYHSVSSILSDFNRAFTASVTRHREYDLKQNAYDDLHAYAFASRNQSYLSEVSHCKNGLLQDAMMSYAYFSVTDHGIRFVPALQGISFMDDYDFDIDLSKFRKMAKKRKSLEINQNELRLQELDDYIGNMIVYGDTVDQMEQEK